MAIATTNPTTGETLRTFEPLSDDALEDKLARAAAAAATYRRTTPRSARNGCATPPTCWTPTPTRSPSS